MVEPITFIQYNGLEPWKIPLRNVRESQESSRPNIKLAIAWTENHDARCFQQSNAQRLTHVLRKNDDTLSGCLHTRRRLILRGGCLHTRRWLILRGGCLDTRRRPTLLTSCLYNGDTYVSEFIPITAHNVYTLIHMNIFKNIWMYMYLLCFFF